MEEGEEVEQASGIPSTYCRSPVTAPLGISVIGKGTRKVLRNGSATSFYIDSCLNSGELPNTSSLKTILEQKLETESLKISTDCVNLLNNGLDVHLKRLIKPCLELASSRLGNMHTSEVNNQVVFGLNGMRPMRYVQKLNRPVFASLLDFQVAMESNPRREVICAEAKNYISLTSINIKACLASTRMCILFFGIGDTPCANKGYLRYSTDSRAKQMDNWEETHEKEFYHRSSYTSVEEPHSRP
ncbi:hypothetical protein LOK49_LG04G00842 [Camellia lanceoleosa]|uniref:Uncharacterized protein n=1 Tax=Camellia lanceoleosa TaxID=1840588 RepID=A0ACC0HUY0_9ERIC|nr:hypothetical protein LOK49_LG04G00842 [Camellia lanceoleosa]